MQYKIHTLTCMECGTAIGYSWKPIAVPEHCLCYLCMHSVCDVSEALGCKDLTTQDLYAADTSGVGNEKRQGWRLRVLAWKRKMWDNQTATKKSLDKNVKLC